MNKKLKKKYHFLLMSSKESKCFDQDDMEEKENFFLTVKFKTGQKIKPIIQAIDGKLIYIGYHGPKHPWDPYRTFTTGAKDWHGWGNITYFVDNFKKWYNSTGLDRIYDISEEIIRKVGINEPVVKRSFLDDAPQVKIY